MFRPIFARSVDEVDWDTLCKNPSAMGILEEYPDQINYDVLAENPSAVDFFESRHNYVKRQEMKDPQFVDEFFSGIPLGYNLVENMNAIHHIRKFVDEEMNSEYRNEWFWTHLSGNPNAIEILERFPEHIDWKKLSGNPSAIELLEKNKDKIVWKKILKNTNASHALLREAITKLGMTEYERMKPFTPKLKKYWSKLLANPNIVAVRIVQSHFKGSLRSDELLEYFATYNQNPVAVKMIEEKEMDLKRSSEKTKILEYLAYNPSAIYLFTRENLHKYNINLNLNNFLHNFCYNPKAIHILEENMESLDYKALSGNPNAIHLLFPLDTLRMKSKIASFKKELTAYVEFPERKSRIFSIYSTPSATQLVTSTTTKKRKISSYE